MATRNDPEKEKKQRKGFLKQASEMLLDMKKQLLKEMQGRVKEETEGVKDEGRDTYYLASDERDREINFILNDREREKLLAIDEALERIKDKTYDLASDERDREINFILNDREREKLLAIDEALERIKDKTYGLCESCEGEIQLGRLKVLPFTRLCVKCQEENEKESKRQKTLEDERGYRKLVISDIEEDGF